MLPYDTYRIRWRKWRRRFLQGNHRGRVQWGEYDPLILSLRAAIACLVWLTEKAGIAKIVTVDSADFTTYRINGRTPFDLVPWMHVSA